MNVIAIEPQADIAGGAVAGLYVGLAASVVSDSSMHSGTMFGKVSGLTFQPQPEGKRLVYGK